MMRGMFKRHEDVPQHLRRSRAELLEMAESFEAVAADALRDGDMECVASMRAAAKGARLIAKVTPSEYAPPFAP